MEHDFTVTVQIVAELRGGSSLKAMLVKYLPKNEHSINIVDLSSITVTLCKSLSELACTACKYKHFANKRMYF